MHGSGASLVLWNHTVTVLRHPIQVNVPHLNLNQRDPEGWKAELALVDRDQAAASDRCSVLCEL